MSTWAFYDKATALIPFTLKGYNGKVAVYYGVNDDPIRVGFDSLTGLNFDIDQCRGYPVIHARIESYDGSGYRMLCGWIQIVTSVYLDSHDRENAHEKTFVSIDVAPSLDEANIPFASFGISPQLFDAPCLNLGNYAELRWTADTFLTTMPIRSRNEEISRLLGFRWGYTETNIPDQAPRLLPLEVTDTQVWNSHVPFLQKQYSDWRFRSAATTKGS
jgi:hypothetical protein